MTDPKAPPADQPSPIDELIARIAAKPRTTNMEGPFPLRGEEVYVRSWGGTQRDTFEADTIELEERGGKRARLVGLRARVLAASVCTKDGELIFDASNPEHLALIGSITNEETEDLFDAASTLCRLTKAAVEAAAGKSAT